MIKLSDIKLNPDNPRIITDDDIRKLKKSIKQFEKMMWLRPMIVDETMMTLGGNGRLLACQALGYEEIPDGWIKRADGVVDGVDLRLTEDEKLEFIAKDNAHFGRWDYDELANKWDGLPLAEWGIDVPDFDAPDPSEFFEDVAEEHEQEGVVIKLQYTEEEGALVKAELAKIAKNAEQAVWTLLGL